MNIIYIKSKIIADHNCCTDIIISKYTLFPTITFPKKFEKAKNKNLLEMKKKILLQQRFLQSSTRFATRDFFVYSTCKLKALLYEITGRRWSPYIKNFSKEPKKSSLLTKLVEEGLRRGTTNYFVYTFLTVLENINISQAFSHRSSTSFDKSGNPGFPLQKISIVYSFHF